MRMATQEMKRASRGPHCACKTDGKKEGSCIYLLNEKHTLKTIRRKPILKEAIARSLKMQIAK